MTCLWPISVIYMVNYYCALIYLLFHWPCPIVWINASMLSSFGFCNPNFPVFPLFSQFYSLFFRLTFLSLFSFLCILYFIHTNVDIHLQCPISELHASNRTHHPPPHLLPLPSDLEHSTSWIVRLKYCTTVLSDINHYELPLLPLFKMSNLKKLWWWRCL